MRNIDWKKLSLRFVLSVLALSGPTAFPLSQMGYGSLHDLAQFLLLPSIAVIGLSWAALRKWGDAALARTVSRGAAAGAVATLALEAVRYSGFRLGFMPGNLPELMGVLLLDRFALGPSTVSNLAGFAYHFWNGAAFGMLFALWAAGRSRFWALPYGIAIGLGFLLSPVVQALGVGVFGKDFGWHFAATVLTAHAAFGAALGCVFPPARFCPWAGLFRSGSGTVRSSDAPLHGNAAHRCSIHSTPSSSIHP